jgi:predicted CXXCH cytochrome family protein
MQPATASTVLGDFADARFRQSTFFRRDGRFFARTDGADDALHDYQITHTFGVAPLQQYLVAFPDGRFQALPIAWDSRPRTSGGQRWFHLQPKERITGHDPLHWTGVTENWNYMCADCHSTNVRKGYDARRGSYNTRFSAPSVSCEACHGPGSVHAATGGKTALPIALDERNGVVWARDAAGQPHRSSPRTSDREIEMCARCHSRRGLIHEDHVHGQPVGDDYRVALLDDALYYADGQIKDEVYEYGSFLQSRMFAEGVTCSDCHDPHRPELRATGDNLCLKCHAEKTYFTAKHHFHPAGSSGARCVSCHMPATNYMVVDARRDHSLRVPRPDLSVTLGVPNPCTGCHADQSARWAARTVERWYGHTPSGHQRFAEALAAGTQGAPGAPGLLKAVIDDRRQPAIARASAVARLTVAPSTVDTFRNALRDPDALVRRAAVESLAHVDPSLRGPLVSPLLEDPVRSVRLEAAEALDQPTTELMASYVLNGDRPETHLALAKIEAGQQHFDLAEAALQRALAIDPGFVPAAVNLADLYRQLQRDGEAEPMLRAALAHAPDHPTLLHALGLVLVRQQRLHEATALLGAAARGGADNPRFGYVYAVALHSDGQRREAVRTLEALLARHRYDRDSLAALQAFYREAGELRKANQLGERLAALTP